MKTHAYIIHSQLKKKRFQPRPNDIIIQTIKTFSLLAEGDIVPTSNTSKASKHKYTGDLSRPLETTLL